MLSFSCILCCVTFVVVDRKSWFFMLILAQKDYSLFSIEGLASVFDNFLDIQI